MKCIEFFEQTFHQECDSVAFCPYRICPIGAHSDHNFGKITGLAIDKGIHIAYKAESSGVIEVASLQFESRKRWHIHQVNEKPVGDWADYLRGATWALNRRYSLNVGLCGIVEGSLPIGGLSSSAAVIIVFLAALSKLNDIHLTERNEIGRAHV